MWTVAQWLALSGAKGRKAVRLLARGWASKAGTREGKERSMSMDSFFILIYVILSIFKDSSMSIP